jgi:hypothetical protein
MLGDYFTVMEEDREDQDESLRHLEAFFSEALLL